MGVQSLHYSGHAADLRGGALVLGVRIDQVIRSWGPWQLGRNGAYEGRHTSRYCSCMRDVGCWLRIVLRFTQILQTSTGQDSFLLSFPVQKENHHR